MGLTSQDLVPGTRTTVASALLAVHKSFLKPVTALMKKKVPIQGMAHITGGGFVDNIPRVLPKRVNAEIDRSTWTVPPVFNIIERQGKVDHDEMYRVFNMGIGYVLFLREADVPAALKVLSSVKQPVKVIGRVTKGTGIVTYSDKK